MAKKEPRLFKVEFKSTDAPVLNDQMKSWLESFWKDDTGSFTISLDDLENWKSENEIPETVGPLYNWLVKYLREEPNQCVSFEIIQG